MKSAYELAMEKLDKTSPQPKLTDEQRKVIAEIDGKFKAKIAEKEMFLGDQITKATKAGQFDQIPPLEEQRTRELQRLRSECESEKEKVHSGE
ncbi:MAG: hypothetical protein GXP30_09135 [Verrucomicrobia bacterium]|nr:hypothetical protein [Verrucomicrobiota bacterium]